MSLVTCHVSISLDGFLAGPNQSLENPIGVGGLKIHEWHFQDEPDNQADVAARDDLMRTMGAVIMGRNMYGPIRGEWDADWRGWWGDDPPYHSPVFVLTHYPHEPIEMDGGTTFYFVTGGFDAAFDQAKAAAAGGDIRIAGGVSGNRRYLSVTPDGTKAYVANHFDGTVSQYSIGTNGVLTALNPSVVI